MGIDRVNCIFPKSNPGKLMPRVAPGFAKQKNIIPKIISNKQPMGNKTPMVSQKDFSNCECDGVKIPPDFVD